MRPPSLLCARHAEAARLGVAAALPPLLRQRKLLFGRRTLRFPLMALLVSRELGPARHAVAQRAVAGAIVYLPGGPTRRVAAPPAPSLVPDRT